MGDLKIGAALGTYELETTGEAPRWTAMAATVAAAESEGFDLIWIPDELLWEDPQQSEPSGWWECVALLGAIAATSTHISIGSWVLSALHRNPALTAKAVETIDEISGGRFVFGFGAGHAGRQGEAFGFPPDRTVGRYEDALKVIVPLIRDGRGHHTGPFHSAVNLAHRPRGPQWPRVPLMLGGHGPKTIGLAVAHADIWSCFATTSSEARAFGDLMSAVDAACTEAGRDPKSLERSVGIAMWADDLDMEQPDFLAPPFVGNTDACVAELKRFHEMGFDRVELIMPADDPSVIRAFGPIVLEAKAS
jgi:alkanesulfonate monooxygenase SsuD/methylene tetrahydromethanopterin reductase-like flavin-dependent oxidoreductase (luciferase family)